jgi:galactokinase
MMTAGLSPAEAERKARMFTENDRALDAWRSPGDGERLRWFVPGRIEVLGKHTDYAGGRSLLCAVERGFCVTAAPRNDDVMRVVDVGNGVEALFASARIRLTRRVGGRIRRRSHAASRATFPRLMRMACAAPISRSPATCRVRRV